MNNAIKDIALKGLVAGSLGSLLSTVVLALAGRRQAGSAAAPVNAVSHWYWGDEALQRQETDAAHTAVGYVTHHGASVFWASLYAAAVHGRPALQTAPATAVGALATSALACFVDYKLTPKRLTPGFEHRLDTGAMVGVYAAMAVGVAAGALLMRERAGTQKRQARQPEIPTEGQPQGPQRGSAGVHRVRPYPATVQTTND